MCHTQTTSHHQTDRPISLSSHWEAILPADGLPGFTFATASCSIPSFWPANICTCCSRTAVRFLQPSVSCNLVTVIGRLAMLHWAFVDALAILPPRAERLASRTNILAAFGAACLRPVMLATTKKERSASCCERFCELSFAYLYTYILISFTAQR